MSETVSETATDAVVVEPRWLNEAELTYWKDFIGVLVELPYALSHQLQRDAELTMFEYLFLVMLAEDPQGSRRMSQLAEATRGRLPRLSQVATRLEERGFITRASDPTDRRSTRATLTESGRAKLVASAPGHVELVRTMVFDPLTPAQVQQLGEISARLSAAMTGLCPPADS